MDAQAIQEKIETLKAERDKFVGDVNQQLAFISGQIEALENLIAPPEDAEP